MQKELEELWSQLAVPDSYEPLGVPARPASSCKRQPASFGDRILGSAAGGDWDSRFREQAPNPKTSARRTIETFATARCFGPAGAGRSLEYPCMMFIRGESSMTFTIHARKNDQCIVTVRISAAVAVDKARTLQKLGWQVHVTDSSGRQFDPPDFDLLLSIARETA
jgi:hypothetical protein